MSETLQPAVFVYRDIPNEAMLDEISDGLRQLDIRVLRASRPGGGAQRMDFANEVRDGFFAECDVAIFGSRSFCTRELLLGAPRLRAVLAPTVGLETVDVAAATELGIAVGHGPVPENNTSMAEANVMLILTLFYQLRQTEEVLRGLRTRPPQAPDRMFARMLQGRTVGMIGFGRMARETTRLLAPFGVDVIVHTRSAPTDLPQGVSLVDFEVVMAQSDIVCVFATATPASQGLISRAAIGLMKKTAYFLNTSRGSLVDETALFDALSAKRIAGAALDTFATEPLPDDSPLRLLDNVILTPHMVGHTQESVRATISTAITSVVRVLQGELPLYCRNAEIRADWELRCGRLGKFAWHGGSL